MGSCGGCLVRCVLTQACFLLAVTGCAQNSKSVALPSTISASNEVLPKQALLPAPVRLEPEFAPNKVQILATQNALAALGYDVGKRDGKWGPATARALLAFERDRGVRETGHLTADMVEKIKIAGLEGANLTPVAVHPGDLLVFSDGEREIADAGRNLLWESDARPALVAILPAMRNWPAAARAGLNWALTHALDEAQSDDPVRWSSTGVEQQFEIRTYASLTQKEEARIGGDPSNCRHFELKSEGPISRYPGIACRDPNGTWYIPHSSVQFSRPTSELSTNTNSTSIKR